MDPNTQQRHSTGTGPPGYTAATDSRNVNMSNATRPVYTYPDMPYYPYVPQYHPYYEPSQQQQYPPPHPGPGPQGWFYPYAVTGRAPPGPVHPAIAGPPHPAIVAPPQHQPRQHPNPVPHAAPLMLMNHAHGGGPVVQGQHPPIDGMPDNATRRSAAHVHEQAQAASAVVQGAAEQKALEAGTSNRTMATDENIPARAATSGEGWTSVKREESTVQVAAGKKRALSEIDVNTDRVKKTRREPSESPEEDEDEVDEDEPEKIQPKPIQLKQCGPGSTKFSHEDLNTLTKYVDMCTPTNDAQWRVVGRAFNEWARENGRNGRNLMNLRRKWDELVSMEVPKTGRERMRRAAKRARNVEEKIQREIAGEEESEDDEEDDEGEEDEDEEKSGEGEDAEDEDNSENEGSEGEGDKTMVSERDFAIGLTTAMCAASEASTNSILAKMEADDVSERLEELDEKLETLDDKLIRKDLTITKLRGELDFQKARSKALEEYLRGMEMRWAQTMQMVKMQATRQEGILAKHEAGLVRHEGILGKHHAVIGRHEGALITRQEEKVTSAGKTEA